MEYELAILNHCVFVYFLRVDLVQVVDLELLELVILPYDQFGLDTFWGQLFFLGLFGWLGGWI